MKKCYFNRISLHNHNLHNHNQYHYSLYHTIIFVKVFDDQTVSLSEVSII